MVAAHRNMWATAMRMYLFAMVMGIGAVTGSTVSSQTLATTPTAATTATAAKSPAPPNVAWRTLGGDQFWSDELVHGQWRIQRNAITGNYRLLDPANVRRAWGSDEQCRAALRTQIKRAASDATFGRASGNYAARLRPHARPHAARSAGRSKSRASSRGSMFLMPARAARSTITPSRWPM